MGKTFKASVDWLGMVENGGVLPGQDVDPSVNGEGEGSWKPNMKLGGEGGLAAPGSRALGGAGATMMDNITGGPDKTDYQEDYQVGYQDHYTDDYYVQAGTELSMCSNGEWNGESVKTGCGYRDSAHNLYGSAGLTLGDISDKSMSGSARAGLGYSTHIPYSPITGHLGLSGGTRFNMSENDTEFNPILDATGSVGIEGEFGGNSYNWREPWKYGAGIYGRQDLTGGTGTTAGLYGNVGLFSGKVGYNPNTGAEATIGFGLPIRQDGGERERFKQFIKDNEGGHDYIRAKNSAIKKMDEDGKWDGTSYYPQFDEETKKYYPYFLKDEGYATVGHGHHNKDVYETYKNGITIEKAEELLNNDIDNKISDTEIWWTSKYGEGAWDELDESTQYLLGDYAYNVGHIREYPKFAAAIESGDFETAEKEYIRLDKKGGRELKRNETFMDEYLKPWMNVQKEKITVAPPVNEMPLPIGVYPIDDTLDTSDPFEEFKYGGQLPKFQTTGDVEHLQEIDLTKTNTLNREKINSAAYRDRLRIEYKNAHNKDLTEQELDDMVSQLNVQLEQGDNSGNTGYYTKAVPDPNSLGFMVGGYGKIDKDNNLTTGSQEYALNGNPTKGNIYVSTGVDRNKPYYSSNKWSNDPTTTMQNTIEHHEVNHRLNSLSGSPLSSARNSPLYDESWKYHNSFFDNAPEDNVFNPNFTVGDINEELKEKEDFRKYATAPYEIKSQKAQLEQALQDAGIWDPTQGPMTQEHFDELAKSGFKINEGVDYLSQGLGLGTLNESYNLSENPDVETNIITGVKGQPYSGNQSYGYDAVTQKPYYQFLGGDDKEFSDWDGDGEGEIHRNDPFLFNSLENRIDNIPRGNKKWRKWADDNTQISIKKQDAYNNKRNLKDVLENGYSANKDLDNFLETHGIVPDEDGYYSDEHTAKIQGLLTNAEDTYNALKEEYDLNEEKRPNEEGIFGAFGLFGDKKSKKQKKKSTKIFNAHYKTDYKNWDEIEEAVSREEVGILNDKSIDDPNTYNMMGTQIDQDLDNLTEGLKNRGGYDNYKEWEDSGDSKYAFEIDGYGQRKIKNLLYPHKGGRGYWEDNDDEDTYNASKKHAEERGVATSESQLFNNALDQLSPKYREAFEWYANRDEDGEQVSHNITTREQVRTARKYLTAMKRGMREVRAIMRKERGVNDKYIEDQNRIYNENYQKSLNQNKEKFNQTKEKIGPNFIKFMNEVAMEEEGMPSGMAKYGGQHNWALDLRPTVQAGKEVKSDDIYANDKYSQSASKYIKMLPKYQSEGAWDDFEDSKVGKFIDARGLRQEKDFWMNQFGYEPGKEEKDFALDAAAVINPIPDFIHAGTKFNEEKYTDAALYAGFGILPFTAGPLVKGTKKYLINPIKDAAERVSAKRFGLWGNAGQSTTHTYNPGTKSWIENNAPKVQEKLLANDAEYLVKQDYLTNKITRLQQGKIKITQEIKQFKISNPGKPVPNDLSKIDNVINGQLDNYNDMLNNVPPTYTHAKPGDGPFGMVPDHSRPKYVGPTLKSGNDDIIKGLQAELKKAEELDLKRMVGDYKWDNRNIFKKYFDTPKHPFNADPTALKPFWLNY